MTELETLLSIDDVVRMDDAVDTWEEAENEFHRRATKKGRK